MTIVETIEDASGGVATRTGMEKADTSLRDTTEKMVLRIRADIQAEFRKLYWYILFVMSVVIGILKFT